MLDAFNGAFGARNMLPSMPGLSSASAFPSMPGFPLFMPQSEC